MYFFTERAGCSGEIRKEVTDCSEKLSAGIIAKAVQDQVKVHRVYFENGGPSRT